MRSSLVLVSEDTSGLHDIVGTSLTPQDLIRVPVELKQFKHQLCGGINPYTLTARLGPT